MGICVEGRRNDGNLGRGTEKLMGQRNGGIDETLYGRRNGGIYGTLGGGPKELIGQRNGGIDMGILAEERRNC